MKYMHLKEEWIGENSFEFLSGGIDESLFGVKLNETMFIGCVNLMEGKISDAIRCFPLINNEFKCLSLYLTCGDWKLVDNLYSQDVVRAVKNFIDNPLSVLTE